MNVLQHHLKGDCSQEAIMTALAWTIAHWNFKYRETWLKNQWTKHHGKDSADKLRVDVGFASDRILLVKAQKLKLANKARLDSLEASWLKTEDRERAKIKAKDQVVMNRYRPGDHEPKTRNQFQEQLGKNERCAESMKKLYGDRESEQDTFAAKELKRKACEKDAENKLIEELLK